MCLRAQSDVVDILLDLFPRLPAVGDDVPTPAAASETSATYATPSRSTGADEVKDPAASDKLTIAVVRRSRITAQPVPVDSDNADDDAAAHYGPQKQDLLRLKSIELIRILGMHSLTVKQLKRFFTLMKAHPVPPQLQPPEVEQVTTASNSGVKLGIV